MSGSAISSRHAIVLGLSPAGLYLVREFVDAGLAVTAVHDGASGSLASRYLRRCRIVRLEGDGELEEFLLAETAGAVPVFPTADRYIAFLSSRTELFSGRLLFPGCYAPDRFSLFLDKERFYGVCADAGVAFPARLPLAEAGDGSAVGFPLLVKPGRLHEVTDVMAGKKVFRCTSPEELAELRKRLPAGRGGWIAQEIVEGADTDIICIGGVRRGADGSLSALIAGRKLRQFPPGFGTASALHISSDAMLPELLCSTELILERLGLTGFFEIEFKRDRKDGVWKVFEVNPRSALWFQGARAAGVPLALEALEELGRSGAAGVPVGGTVRNPEPGPETIPPVLWRAGVKDLAVRLFYLLRRGGKRFPAPDRSLVRSACGARNAWAYGERGDWGPAVRELFSLFRKVLRRIV